MMLSRMPLFDVDPFLSGPVRAPQQGGGQSPIRLQEDEKFYHVTFIVPGVRTEDIKATFEDHVLHVSGETKTEHRRAYFDRAVTLPRDADIFSDDVCSEHQDGVLTISVPKKAPARRQLAISASGADGKFAALHIENAAEQREQGNVPAEKTAEMADAGTA